MLQAEIAKFEALEPALQQMSKARLAKFDPYFFSVTNLLAMA